jgi:acyl-CoA thioesterase I
VQERRSLVIVAACLAALFLQACARKREVSPQEQRNAAAPSSPPTQVSAEAPDNRPVIVTFGDSLTAGVVDRNYPGYLQELLDANHYAYRVDNQGVSGDTTTDGLARIDNVIAAHPALVVLEFGGNDGLRGVPIESTRKNLEEMITRLRDARLPTVLAGITLPPNYGPDYVKPFTALFPQLAKQYKLKLIPFLLVHVYQNSNLMQPDGIHPNSAGNKIVAQDIFDLIKPLLTKGPEAAAHP